MAPTFNVVQSSPWPTVWRRWSGLARQRLRNDPFPTGGGFISRSRILDLLLLHWAAGRPPRAHRPGPRIWRDLTVARDLDARHLQRPRGGSGRDVAGLAVGNGHPGAGWSVGDQPGMS